MDPTHKEVNRPTTGGSSCERNKTQPTASTSTQPQTHCGSVSEVSKLVDKIITIEPVSWPLAIIKNKGKHAIAQEARVRPGGK